MLARRAARGDLDAAACSAHEGGGGPGAARNAGWPLAARAARRVHRRRLRGRRPAGSRPGWRRGTAADDAFVQGATTPIEAELDEHGPLAYTDRHPRDDARVPDLQHLLPAGAAGAPRRLRRGGLPDQRRGHRPGLAGDAQAGAEPVFADGGARPPRRRCTWAARVPAAQLVAGATRCGNFARHAGAAPRAALLPRLLEPRRTGTSRGWCSRSCCRGGGALWPLKFWLGCRYVHYRAARIRARTRPSRRRARLVPRSRTRSRSSACAARRGAERDDRAVSAPRVTRRRAPPTTAPAGCTRLLESLRAQTLAARPLRGHRRRRRLHRRDAAGAGRRAAAGDPNLRRHAPRDLGRGPALARNVGWRAGARPADRVHRRRLHRRRRSGWRPACGAFEGDPDVVIQGRVEIDPAEMDGLNPFAHTLRWSHDGARASRRRTSSIRANCSSASTASTRRASAARAARTPTSAWRAIEAGARPLVRRRGARPSRRRALGRDQPAARHGALDRVDQGVTPPPGDPLEPRPRASSGATTTGCCSASWSRSRCRARLGADPR